MILPVGGKRRQGRQIPMPKYLLLFKYSSEGAKGFLKEKAARREAEIRKTFAGMGGKVEALYWATGGEHSGAIVMELPDAATPSGVYDGCPGNRRVRCASPGWRCSLQANSTGPSRRRQPTVHPAADAFDVPTRRAARQRGLYVSLKPSAPERSGVCRLTPAISLSLCVHTGTDGESARLVETPPL